MFSNVLKSSPIFSSDMGVISLISFSICSFQIKSQSLSELTITLACEPAEVPTKISASLMGSPASSRPLRYPSSQAIPKCPPPPNTTALFKLFVIFLLFLFINLICILSHLIQYFKCNCFFLGINSL